MTYDYTHIVTHEAGQDTPIIWCNSYKEAEEEALGMTQTYGSINAQIWELKATVEVGTPILHLASIQEQAA